jgi:hypothetical protein
MTAVTEALPVGPAVARDYPHWAQCRQVCDLGGGLGHLLADLLRVYPNMTGLVLDQPEVVPRAEAYLRSHGLGPERASAVAVDFMQPLGVRCECMVLKMVLHDWSDEIAVRILRNAVAALQPRGRVLVVDSVLEPPAGVAARTKVCVGLWKWGVRWETDGSGAGTDGHEHDGIVCSGRSGAESGRL